MSDPTRGAGRAGRADRADRAGRAARAEAGDEVDAPLADPAGPPAGDGDAAGDRVVSPIADGDERAIEAALRPKRLEDFTGQARVREQLSLVLHGALRRGSPPDHVLLCG